MDTKAHEFNANGLNHVEGNEAGFSDCCGESRVVTLIGTCQRLSTRMEVAAGRLLEMFTALRWQNMVCERVSDGLFGRHCTTQRPC
jgi:hypothetical protein